MEVITAGSDKFRVGSWRGDPMVGYLMPLTRIGPGTIDTAIRSLHSEGYRRIVTGALGHVEQGPFLRQGFSVLEKLHLLDHPLRSLPGFDQSIQIRRGRRRERDSALVIDQQAFDDFWRFDSSSFREAMDATPTSRFRVAIHPNQPLITGYSITGRAGRTGYLQRLAVDPAFQGQGIGSALIGDALTWCKRRRLDNVLVNTQESNQNAFDLYVRLGFVPVEPGLAVLELDL